MINKIFGYFKSSNASLKDTIEKVRLTGSFHKKTIGGSNEAVGDECTLSLTIVNEKTFDYNLDVRNEEYQYASKININNSDTWEVISFALTNDRGFKLCQENVKEALVWEFNRDFYIFYFFIDSENKKNKPEFLSNMINLIASYEYAADFATVSTMEGKETSDYLTEIGEVENIANFLEANFNRFYAKEEEPKDIIDINKINHQIDIAKELDSKLNITQLDFKSTYPSAKMIFEAKGILHKYDKVSDELVVVSDKAVIGIYSVSAFNYFLPVFDDKGKTLTLTSISQEINLIANRNENLIMWLSRDTFNSNERTAYNFVFFDENKVDLFQRIITKTQYEASAMSKYEDLKEEDQHWLENQNMPDEDENEDTEDVEMEMENEFQESSTDRLNKLTSQAYLHDRTFVVRDDNTIGVYKTDEEDVLTHLANLPAVVKYEDKTLDISNAQMFYSDTNMIFLDKNNPSAAFRYDLGKGKIVEEWSADTMKSIDQIAPENKFAQMTDNQIVLGVNKNNLFAMDARVNKKNKVVASKSYKTVPKMNCVVSTEFGGVATGSLNGEVRLYGEVGKNAKTLLPCFGDAIRSIDVTADGKFLLATCDKYLILIPTTCKGSKNGFTAQMGKEKPNPRTLKIKPIDVNKYHLEGLNFTSAKFNVSKENAETNIITSLGDYVVVWNFSKIRKGILDDYKIKKVNQNVIENQFKFNRNQIVVTMDHKLRIQNQKQLFPDNK